MNRRTILITGGSGKFGRALVNHFLAAGDSIVATCRTEESLEQLKTENFSYRERFLGCKVDLTEHNAIELLREELDAQAIRPDCLINNARSLGFLKIGEDGLVSRENFTNEYLLDVVVPYELTMALVKQQESQLKKVLNIGSQYGSVAANPHLYTDPAIQSPLHYSVAKAALAHLTKELAVRLAASGIQVNCVAYGGVEGRVDEAFKQRYAQLCPMGRMLRDDEVVGPVDMLLSDKCSGVTGHILAVDGGWGIW
ncbi:MAG: SDR family oxidoreductase [Chlorobiaceae bacterium]|nr:SDR family oxidoreductase [Chlorobiaceae bacterium]